MNENQIGNIPGASTATEQSGLLTIVGAHDRHVGEEIDVDDSGAAANAEFAVTHHLGFIPNQVELLVREGQTDAYLQIRPGATAWTKTAIYLDCSSANAALRLRVS